MTDPLEKYIQAPGHVCPAEHSGWLTISARKLVNNPRRLLEGLIGEGETAADLGCGPGFFTLPLAQLVGASGRVVAVDVQEAMLSTLRARAERAGLDGRIQLHLARPDTLALEDAGIAGKADLALAFWMVHEVPDRDRFLREVAGIVKPGGHFLLAEPRAHVSKTQFAETVASAEAAGFSAVAAPRTGFSRTALLRRG